MDFDARGGVRVGEGLDGLGQWGGERRGSEHDRAATDGYRAIAGDERDGRDERSQEVPGAHEPAPASARSTMTLVALTTLLTSTPGSSPSSSTASRVSSETMR